MHQILNKKYSRKSFLFTVFLIALILILARYLILPCIDNSIKTGLVVFLSNIADGLLGSLLVAVFIGLFLFWLTPDEVKEAKIEVAEPRQLAELFDKSFPTTDLWWYKGGCGRHFRTKTLPQMATWARNKSLSREVIAVILDPTNSELCENHANYRRSTASSLQDKSKWDAEKVRTELCATILTTLAYQIEEPMLRISLYLCSHYSAFRIDLSTEYVIITKEDRNAPAIICPNNTHFYRSYKDEILLSSQQSKKVQTLRMTDFHLDSIDGEKVSAALAQLGLKDSEMTQDFFNKVATICKEKINPYG